MLEDNKKKVLIIGAICVVVVVGGILYYFAQNMGDEEYIDFESLETNVEMIVQNEIVEETMQIVVHISGNIVNPGVISLEEGSRLIDAINKAGGLTAEADISKVNLAYVLEDAQKIYIPSKNEEEEKEYVSDGSGDAGIVTDTSGKVESTQEKLMININTASQAEFEKLPGIGSSIAIRIVNYRKENGKFNTIEDIKNVSGIGEAKFNNIKNYICIK